MNLARVSCCTYPLRDVPYPDAFARLAATGLTRLDVWGRAPHFSADGAECDPDALEAAARDAGVCIANLGTYCGRDFDRDDPQTVFAELEATRRTIQLAARFGARTVRALPGHSDDPAVIDKVAPHYRAVMAEAEAAGVYLVMENHRGSLAGEPALALRLCEAVGSDHFGVLYEPCNLLQAGTDYKVAFSTFRDWVKHIHLKDGRWTERGFERCHLGEGEVDLGWCLAAMEGIGYDGDYALEYEIPEVEPVDSGLVRWREFIELV